MPLKAQYKGYTVSFEGNQTIEQLNQYFTLYSEEKWFLINEQVFWAEESIVFDLLDYLEAHFDTSNIFVSASKKTNPLDSFNEKEPIKTLHEKKAG